jgi:hypothetical protein
MASAILQAEQVGARNRGDRRIFQGRVVAVNRLAHTLRVDAGQELPDGTPAYLEDVSYTPQNPPSVGDTGRVLYPNASMHGAYWVAGGLSGQNSQESITNVGGVTTINKIGSTALKGAVTLSASGAASLVQVGQNIEIVVPDPSALDWKASCRVATTANITLSGAQTIDGVSVIAGERVLVKSQTTGSQNGIYVCASGAWSRAVDADVSADVTAGLAVLITEGSTYADTVWLLTTNDAITLGTTALVFAQLSAGMSDPMTTAGDQIVRNASNVTARLAIGSVAQVMRVRGGTPIHAWEFMDESLPLDLDRATIKNHAGTTAIRVDINAIFSNWYGEGIRLYGGASDDNSIYFGPEFLHRYFYTGYIPSIQIYYFNPRTTLAASSGNVYLQMELVGADAGISLALAPTATAYGTAKAAPAAKTVDFIEIVPGALESSFGPARWSQLRIRRDSSHASDTTTEDIVIVGVDLVFQRQ